jgi:hypothetical protein
MKWPPRERSRQQPLTLIELLGRVNDRVIGSPHPTARKTGVRRGPRSSVHRFIWKNFNHSEIVRFQMLEDSFAVSQAARG